ncbi:MAG: hypothetical protein QW795_03140 [Candidatus Bathyarchaeia archaeon]
MEEEKLRRIAELREILEERIRSLEGEIEGLRALLEFVNEILLEVSFKRAEEMVAPPKAAEVAPVQPPSPPQVKAIPLKTGGGENLANIYIEGRNMRVIPEADKKFDVGTPPFKAFLVDKVLMRMHEVDQEAVRKGELMPDEALSFDIKTDGNILREILVRNITPQRERELRSAIRWTLEKMYEKTRA